MSSDPLQTRSLPGALWEKVPQEFAQADEAIRQKAMSLVDLSAHPWPEISWLTQTSAGMILGLSSLTIFWIVYMLARNSFRVKAFAKVLNEILTVALVVGIGDLFASLVKYSVGRFKPHVNFYSPDSPYTPALSFPSNHAFNAACVLGLSLCVGRKNDPVVWLICLLGTLIGASRVFLGQHYPSDVLGGWGLGFAFGAFGGKLVKRFITDQRKGSYVETV